MKLDPDTGLFDEIEFISSPNFNQRPQAQEISLLVIHGISLPAGEFTGDAVKKLFLNQYDEMSLQVSAHIFIRRDGSLIQFVPLHLRAWHAGVSVWEGKENCNDYSIGIELEGTDTIPYEAIQYGQLNLIIKEIQKNYPAITRERIVGHSDIAPGRKTDPGPAFCWENIL